MTQHPFYYAPELGERETDEVISLVVGSDLIVSLRYEGEPKRHRIYAFDSSGNQLAVLANCYPATYMHVLPLAVDTAVRLFPNHLLTPIEG